MKRLLPMLGVVFGVVSGAVLPGCTRAADETAVPPASLPATTATSVATSSAPAPTVPATPSTVPATVPATVPPTSPAVTEPPTPSTSRAPGGPTVVYAGAGGYALTPVGWWDGGWHAVGFVDGDATVPDAAPAVVSIASSDLDAVLTGVPAPPALYQCVEGPGLPSIEPVFDLPQDAAFTRTAVAVGASWELQPRPVRAVGLDAPDYQVAGEALVPTDTGADPAGGDVTQVLRADLDGDGIEEVLFVFERQTDSGGTGAPGDFSLVVARLPDATGGVIDQVLYSHVTPDAPLEFPVPDRGRVAAIADLNGDGTMEVAITVVYWEGSGVEVFELAGGELRSVMDAGCGV